MNRQQIIQHISTAKLIDVHTHTGMDAVNFYRGDFPYAQSAEDLLVRLDRWGVDVAVTFPFLYSRWFDFADFLQGRMTRAAAAFDAPYAPENELLCREIYEAYPQCAGRLLPFMFFDPARAQKEQVAVLRRLSEKYPVFGLKTASSYLHAQITELLSAGSVLLDFAVEQNWPVMIHTAVHPDDPWANVHKILDVVKARPDVRFCLAHTCRFDRRALDEAAELPNCFVDFSAFNIHCQLAIDNHPAVAVPEKRFSADYSNHAVAMKTIAEAYPETMIWGTDSPYYCFMSRFINESGEEIIVQLSCATDTEINEFNKLPETMRRQIGIYNSQRWLLGENRKDKS
ncbi:MAG: amidohydrolase family protein [Kiritimatiellales bacterium]